MSILFFILSNLGAILAGIKGVEDALKGAPGKTKKQIVLDAIKAGAEATTQITDKHAAAIGAVIDSSVDALNKSGVFNHSTSTSPAIGSSQPPATVGGPQ